MPYKDPVKAKAYQGAWYQKNKNKHDATDDIETTRTVALRLIDTMRKL